MRSGRIHRKIQVTFPANRASNTWYSVDTNVDWRSVLRIIISIILIVFSASTCVALDVDGAKDQQLAQPVTIECVNTRLRVVLEQLDEKTGVAIRCGRDARDWQVRDIPVTVCAKDMPLGTLLKSIASSTHLLLSKEQVGQTIIYRIWRDAKRRKQIDDYFDAKSAWDRAMPGWEWDTVSKLENYSSGNRVDDGSLVLAKQIAGLIAALGPDAKDRVMSGAGVSYPTGSVPESLQGYAKALSDEAYASDNPGLTPDDLRKCSLVVCLDSQGDNPTVCIRVDAVLDQQGTRACVFPLTEVADYASGLGIADMPKQPEKPKPPAWETPDGDWADFGGATEVPPALQAKAGLEKPKDKKPITCGSLLAMLSKASGFTIICEDFETHRRPIKAENLFSKDATINDVLTDISRDSDNPDGSGFVWHVNAKDKTIIGTADDWLYHHRNLVSESLLDYLKTKLDGDGVDLDDYLRVMALEQGQLYEWISCSSDLAILDAYTQRPSHKDFWMFYDSLSKSQKAQAQTESGLPMSNLHPAYLAYLISSQEHEQFPYDERSVADLVMRVEKKKEQCYRTSRAWSDGMNYAVGVYMADTYNMRFEVTQNGETHTIDLGGPRGLPLYSPKREKALGIKPVEQK